MVLVSRPAKYDGVAQIAARVTKQPASQFGWVFTKQDYYRDPQMLPNLEALQKNVDHCTREARCGEPRRLEHDRGSGQAAEMTRCIMARPL